MPDDRAAFPPARRRRSPPDTLPASWPPESRGSAQQPAPCPRRLSALTLRRRSRRRILQPSPTQTSPPKPLQWIGDAYLHTNDRIASSSNDPFCSRSPNPAKLFSLSSPGSLSLLG